MGVIGARARRVTRGIIVIGSAIAVAAATLMTATAANADVSPPTGIPSTVTADALPTAQMNGVAWDQVVVGDTVFAGGAFTSARPPGSPLGSDESPRTNLMAYSVSTGALSSFAPSINGQVRQVAASPDGRRLYVVGDFTSVNGQTRNRVAAFELPSLTLSSWNPNANGPVTGVDATNSTVFLTGTFGRISGNDRSGAAAVSVGGALQAWAPQLADRMGRVVLASPDGAKVVLGGSFTSVNGSTNPGYGLAMVDGNTAALLPFGTTNVIWNGGPNAAITNLKSDGESIYGTGYTFGDGGNLEGTFRSSWATGDLTWVADCHGDEYDVQPMGDAVYSVGHPHSCASLEDGFPQSDPWRFYRGVAFSKDVARITPAGLGAGYFDFGGNPAPRQLHWYPTFNAGSITGLLQGPWTINGNSDYLVVGGEFTTVNGTPQQGLVRFGVPAKATNAQGPLLGWNAWVPTATALPSGGVRIGWPSNWDRDSEYLTYEVLRDDVVIGKIENARSKPDDWGLPPFTYIDRGAVAGVTYTYRVRATDAQGHSIPSNRVTAAAIAAPSAVDPYDAAVLADKPLDYWPLEEASGDLGYDIAGTDELTFHSGVTRHTPGMTVGRSTAASTFSGSADGYGATTRAIQGPQTFGLEAWINTTTTAGGKIIGFGNRNDVLSNNYDRHIYMLPDGRISFGVYTGSTQTVTSVASYNDGTWHHVAAGLSSAGMVLYVDGARVAVKSDTTSAQPYLGFWRVGGDSPWTGNAFFAGQIDAPAVYAAPLAQDRVQAHYLASGRTLNTPPVPTDAYASAVRASGPSAYWRLGESSGTVAADSSGSLQPGTYTGSVTLGSPGALKNVADTSVTFSGGQVIGSSTITNPKVFTVEAWVRTTSTSGGKIVGFGDSRTGLSSSYDRGVHMTADGRLVFSVLTGVPTTLQTMTAYNDDAWHHVVASQGPEGMRLYVDGTLVAQNTETRTAAYTGYWHVGGDRAAGISSTAFNGRIDDVAVYDSALSATTVALHHEIGVSGKGPNQLPVASFTQSIHKLALAVDAGASTDADGTIASYAWDWGDGSPASTGATASHVYAQPGHYTVTLTVTDDRGGVDSQTAGVDVIANQKPTPMITTTIDELAVTADATSSTDIDGSITSWSWNWGDGSADSSGDRAAHTYAADGTYTVTLTVRDDDGASSSATASVTVKKRVGATTYANDSFNRTLATGLGSADSGGAWTLTTAATNYRVDGSRGVFLQQGGGAQRFAYLTGVSSTDTAVETTVSLATLPVGGNEMISVVARRVGTADYSAKAIIAPSGAVSLQLLRAGTVLTTTNVGLTLTPGTPLHIRVEATGTSPTTLRAKAWTTTAPQAWTVTATDSTAALQAAGDVGLGVYLGAGVTNGPLQPSFDDLWVGSTTGDPVITNTPPTAAFTAVPTDLSVAFDASTSTDADGTIASYAWDFGDGSPASTGVTATHAYAAGGTYQVKLTVTDDRGATSSKTSAVTVAAAPSSNTPPVAAFTQTVTDLSVAFDATSSTDADGTIASYAWDFGDSTAPGAGATPSHAYANAGTYAVKLTVTDDKGATGVKTATVTVTDPSQVVTYAKDTFTRTLASGLGAADTGGSWTLSSGATNYRVDGSAGVFVQPSGGAQRFAYLTGVSSTDTAIETTVSLPKLPVGGSEYVSVVARRVGTTDYSAKVLVAPSGAISLQLLRAGTVLSTVNPGVTLTAGAPLHVRVEATGTAPTTLRAKVWTTTVPQAWTASTTDSAAELQAAGHVGLGVYLGSGTTNGPILVAFDDLWVGSTRPAGAAVAPPAKPAPPVVPAPPIDPAPPVVPEPPAVDPVAAFTTDPSGLSVAVDASSSSDEDGRVVGYAWDFGDGGRGTGQRASHEYAEAGTYTIALTVTDDSGATNTRTAEVTVSAANVDPVAAFTSSPAGLAVVFDASSSSDADGTISTYSWDFGDGESDTGKKKEHVYATAGTYRVTLTVTDDRGATSTRTTEVVVAPPA